MELPDHARKMLEELREDAAANLAQVQRALSMINMVEEKYGLAPTTLSDFVGGPTGVEVTPAPASAIARTSVGRVTTIRPDQYLGKPPLEAAKIYLGQIGHAAAVDDIANAIEKGGAAVSGPTWRDQLEMSLIRSVADVVKVKEGVFGLARFYTPEQIAALRKARRPTVVNARPLRVKLKKRPKVKLSHVPRRAKDDDDETPQSTAALNGSGESLKA